jgi:predicted dehydrogenase
MPYRIGVIGAGDIARKTYLPLLADRKDCEISAIYSRTESAAVELAKEYGIAKTYTDLDKFLKNGDFDSVFVCTPTATHFEIAQAALQYSKNVLIEKPLTTVYENDISLLNLSDLKSINFCVAFNNYYREENEWLRKKILEGELGEIQIINIEWYRKLPFPSEGPHQGDKPSGVLMHLGAKLLSVALALLPERRSFTVVCQNLKRTSGLTDDEDTSVSSILINNKVTVNMRLGWDIALPVGSQTNMEVFGKNGMASNNDYSGPESDGHKNMINEFLKRCDSDENMDLDLVKDTMTLLNALYQANQNETAISGKFTNA